MKAIQVLKRCVIEGTSSQGLLRFLIACVHSEGDNFLLLGKLDNY